jgi:starvation-inducible DNA-binding protein
MNTLEKLTEVFYDNFKVYYRTHVAHVNVMGPNFYSDHKLLQKVYEDLQDNIDTLAEKIRTLDGFMPNSLQEVCVSGDFPDQITDGDCYRLFELVKEGLEHLIMCHSELIEISEDEGHDEIANYAQDRISSLKKFVWMINSTLG